MYLPIYLPGQFTINCYKYRTFPLTLFISLSLNGISIIGIIRITVLVAGWEDPTTGTELITVK